MPKRRRDRGDGSLFQRTRTLPSGRVVKDWCAVRSLGYDETGKRIRRWFYAATKAEVQFKVEQARAAAGGTLGPINTTTIQQYFEGWLGELERSRSPLTVTGYKQRLTLYAYPNIGNLRLDQLDADRVSRLYGSLYERGVSADNVDKLHKALRRGLNVAIGRGLISKNPVMHVERKAHRSAKRTSIDAKNAKKFFEAIRGHRLEAMFRLQTITMMRPGEIFALERSDLWLDKALVDVRHNLENDGGVLSIVSAKADSARRIPIDTDTVEILRTHLERMDGEKHESPFVFVTKRGKHLREGPANRALREVLERADLPQMTMYGLRHTGASLAAEADVHIRVAADILGHSTTELTGDVYTHARPAMHRDAIEKIAALIRNAA